MSIFGEPLPHEDDTAASLIRRNGFPPGEAYSQLPEVYMCPCCSQLAAGAEDGDEVAWKLMAEKEAARRRLLQLDVFDERARPPRSGDAHSRLRTHRPGCIYGNSGGGSRDAGDGVAAPLVEVPPPPPTTHDLPRAQRTRKPLQRLVVTVHHGTHLAARDASDPLSVVVRCGAFEGQTAQVARGRGTRTTWDELFEFPYPRAADLEVLVINHAQPPPPSSSSSAERERGDGSHADDDNKDKNEEQDRHKDGGDDGDDKGDGEEDKKAASNASDSGSHDEDNKDDDDEEMRQAMGGVTVQSAFLADVARGDEESVPVMHKRDMHASYDAQPDKGPLGDVWLSWRILDEGDEAAVQPNLDQPLACHFVVRRILQYTDTGAEPYTDGVLCVLRDTDDNCSESVLYAYSGVQAPTLSAYYANSGCHYLPENTAQAMQLNTSKKLGHILLCVPKNDTAADDDDDGAAAAAADADADAAEELLVVAAVPLDLERMHHRGTAVLLIESKSHSEVVWGEVEVEWANRPLYGGDGDDKDALQRRAPLPLEVSAEALFVTVVRGLNLTNNAGAAVDHVNLVVATGELEGSTVTTSNVLDVHGVDEHADEDEAGGDNNNNNDDDGDGGARAARRGVYVANWNQEIRFIGVGADKNTVELYAYEDGGLVSVGRCVLRDHDEGVVIVPMHDPHEAASMSHDTHDGNNNNQADGQAAGALTTATDAAVAHGTRGEIVISYRRLHPRIESALVEVAKTQTAAERTAARRAARALHDGDGRVAAAQPEHDEEDEEDEEEEEEEAQPTKQKTAAVVQKTAAAAHPRRASQHDAHERTEKHDDEDDVVAVAATEEVDKVDDVAIEHAEEEEQGEEEEEAPQHAEEAEEAEEEETPQHAEEEEAEEGEPQHTEAEEEAEEAAAAAAEEEEQQQDKKQDEEEAPPQHAEEKEQQQQQQQQPEELEVERDEAAEATPPPHKNDDEAEAEAEAERLAAEEAARRAAEDELRAAREQAAAARAAATEAQEARDAAAAAAAAADRDRAAEEARAAAAREEAAAARAAAEAAEADARAAAEEARAARERAAAAAEERRRQAEAEAEEARRRAEEEKAAAAAAAAAARAEADAEAARRRAEDEEARDRAAQEAAEEEERQRAAEEAEAARDDAAATAAAAGRGRPARAINWKPAPAYSAKYKKPFYPSGSAENESHVPFEKSSLSRKNEASIRGLESYHTRLVEESAHRERSADRHSTSSGATPRDQR